MDGFSIGELASQANVHVETLRYYERRGLIPKPHRTVSNYRVYSSDNLRRLKFIKQAQALGFSLSEIKKLLALRATPRARCADVRRYATRKIEDIDAKIHSLARMRKALQNLLDECSGKGPATECPILESLESEQSMIEKQTKSKPKGGSL
jgi:MerR family mercuric resistance operon transcriptional regulator